MDDEFTGRITGFLFFQWPDSEPSPIAGPNQNVSTLSALIRTSHVWVKYALDIERIPHQKFVFIVKIC